MTFPSTINKFQVKGDVIDFDADLENRTCSCRKFQLSKIPCKHAIKGALERDIEIHTLADELYTTTAWRAAYEESINPIAVPEDEWHVPPIVEDDKVLPPATRRRPGRSKQRRYEIVEDKIRSSKGMPI
ncbi:hypothetical protein V5N11_000465 [Cardamine amara subsp. amara]|uniref:SWIM-type domain-containing protein n=1 Tax=Cardamine amara subsp. amara TaxID=228776 RepID=A0ABD0ZZE2_CARAN